MFTAGDEVSVGQLITAQALMSPITAELEDGRKETRNAANLEFMSVKPCGNADGVDIGDLSVKKLHVPMCLLFVYHVYGHLSHRVVDALDTALVLGW